MTRIRITRTTGPWSEGTIVDMPANTAANLIGHGAAQPADTPTPSSSDEPSATRYKTAGLRLKDINQALNGEATVNTWAELDTLITNATDTITNNLNNLTTQLS